MIIEDLKADLSEAAQAKLKEYIGQIIEKKVQKEVVKITKKLTKRFIFTGVALLGAVVIANNADKIVGLIAKPKN